MKSTRRSVIDVDALISEIATSAVRAALSPLLEGEREEQARTAASIDRTYGDEATKRKRTLLQSEAEEEEGEEKKPETEAPEPAEEPADSPAEEKAPAAPTVTKKMATGKEEPKEPKAIMPNPEDIKDVTFSQVINMMNMMRSGKSAKDPDTKQKLNDYFRGLNPGERQALFVLLSGLTQILAGGVPGEEAPDPSRVGISIKPRRAEEQPTAKTPAAAPKAAPGRPAPRSSEPLPIVVGEAADRRQLMKRVAQLRK